MCGNIDLCREHRDPSRGDWSGRCLGDEGASPEGQVGSHCHASATADVRKAKCPATKVDQRIPRGQDFVVYPCCAGKSGGVGPHLLTN
ncbi:hypothetical protein Rhow_005814 [Rhodococcus wratislaviensis]|uniref:Uncharacterized protein n=1 Tax=Rhodococcus wratislaviensis TaxID=44752 RepID=A0A402BZQ2_RHOWR|nr:hypothetical protein Rhow_005814 [Rhodococcus wratislaviensis]